MTGLGLRNRQTWKYDHGMHLAQYVHLAHIIYTHLYTYIKYIRNIYTYMYTHIYESKN